MAEVGLSEGDLGNDVIVTNRADVIEDRKDDF